ncbi:MAG: amino acid--tRNA ligase-related protein [Spirochaetales bacterium]
MCFRDIGVRQYASALVRPASEPKVTRRTRVRHLPLPAPLLDYGPAFGVGRYRLRFSTTDPRSASAATGRASRLRTRVRRLPLPAALLYYLPDTCCRARSPFATVYVQMNEEIIRARANLLRRTREFFQNEGYIEVDTPHLSPTAIPEEHIDLFRTDYEHPYDEKKMTPLYLLPSPERYMKPLVGKLGGRLFQLAHCFRNRENVSQHHSPEFMMLEYYETDVDEKDLLRRTRSYLRYLLRDRTLRSAAMNSDALSMLSAEPVEFTVEEAFEKYAGIPLFGGDRSSTDGDLVERCRGRGLPLSDDSTWNDAFDYAMAHFVEPSLPTDAPVFLTDYPAASDVLARTDESGTIRHRWELYLAGIEIANCFSEQTDPDAVRGFIARQNEARRLRGASSVPAADDLADSLTGTRDVAGAALGVDRLLMCITGADTIEGVILSPLHATLKD